MVHRENGLSFTDQDEKTSCGDLALWLLHEDRRWRRLDLQVSPFFLWYLKVCGSRQNSRFDAGGLVLTPNETEKVSTLFVVFFFSRLTDSYDLCSVIQRIETKLLK